MTLRPLVVLAALGALVLVAAGCGGERSGSGAEGGGTPPERAFLSAMVPHHRSAVEMATAAEGRIDDDELEQLIAAIGAAQTTEIGEMSGIHERLFGQPLRPNEMAHAQLGLSAEQAERDHMDAGRTVREADEPVDRVVIDQMIPHHQGAIAMARAVSGRVRDERLRELVGDIIATQESEVEELNSIRERQFGAPLEAEAGTEGHSR